MSVADRVPPQVRPMFDRSVSGTYEIKGPRSDRGSKTWLLSSIFWLTFIDFAGLLIAIELQVPNLSQDIEFLQFGRVRPIHVNGCIWMWLTTMYFGMIFYIVPRLCGLRSMWSDRLAVWTAWGWNLTMAAGAVTLAMGYTQGREYAEFIWPVDVAVVTIFMLNIFNILMTVLIRRVRALYVALWWMIASPLWVTFDYVIQNVMWRPGSMLGNSIPGYELSGALEDPMADALINWWGNHNNFGLWLTPMLVAITYYLVPRITNTPLYSHTLSLVSFWGLIFFYTGVGHHHLLQAPIPNWLKTYAVVNSILLLIPVFAFVTNITLTMRGHWEKIFTNMPLRFVITGFIFYFLTNIQGALIAIPSFNRVIHFTNFIVAHAHLALLGGFTILGMGAIDYAICQIYRKPLYSRRLIEWQYWLVLIGFVGFFFSLTFASFLQGQLWHEGQPEVNLLTTLGPHYVARGIFGAMMVASGIVQMVNIMQTIFRDTSAKARNEMKPFIAAGGPAANAPVGQERR